MTKKIMLLLSLFILVLMLFVFTGETVAQFDLEGESVILIEADTGQVLYENDADIELPPASITKIMTLLLVMESVDEGLFSLDEQVNISQYASSMGGSQLFLPSNIELSLEELLKAVSISSANDATVALSEAITGSYSAFIDLMNERAEELGMDNTNFMNSTGLPADNHYTTARDIATMSRELVKYDKILEWSSIWVEYLELPDGEQRMMSNTNRLINRYPGMDGLKTGHTTEAQYCLAATAERGDTRLISVVLQAESMERRQDLTTRLLNYGFGQFSKRKMMEQGENIQNIKIPGGVKTTTAGKVEDDLSVMVKRGESDLVETNIVLNENLEAPVAEGDKIGEVVVFYNGERINAVNITATEDIGQANVFIRLWRSFVNWIGSWLQNI